MRYENEICPGCGRRFAEGDDIVVCPECGTPQHRECYNKEHKCVNEHLHEENYEWKPKHSDQQAPARTEREESVTCPFCGHENPKGAKKCESCGQPFLLFGRRILPGDDDNSKNTDDNYEYKPPFHVDDYKPAENGYQTGEGGEDQGERPFIVGDPFISGNIPDGDIDGVPIRDLSIYLRSSAGSYCRKFKSISLKKPTFNWAAFIFGHLWFFYRKLIKPGIIFLTLTLCLVFGFYNPLNKFYDSVAEITSSVTDADDQSQILAAQDKMNELLNSNKTVISVFFGAGLALRLVMALTADRLYKKKATKDIKAADESFPDGGDEKLGVFLKKGGTSLLLAVTGYLAQYLITMIITEVFF